MGDDWGKIGLLFILTSGHTGQAQKRFVLFLAKLVFEYEPQQKEREKEREKAKLFPSKDKLFIRLKVRSKLVFQSENEKKNFHLLLEFKFKIFVHSVFSQIKHWLDFGPGSR